LLTQPKKLSHIQKNGNVDGPKPDRMLFISGFQGFIEKKG